MKFSEKVIKTAKKIAEECQGHNDAFCTTRCPMHTDAVGYINLIKEGKLEEAVLKMREKIFLPGSLGRICAHPCETECRRNKEYKEPISIAALKRYAADKSDKEELWDVSKKESSGKKVAIIGGGPAGAQGAIELAKEGHKVEIFEKLNVYGGMMRVGIPAYRLPREIIDFEYKYLENLGVEFKMGMEVGKDISFEEICEKYDGIIIANGAHKGSQISTKGDENKNITNAVDFLKLASLEEKSEMPCKKVVVIGGGDVAMDSARTSLRLGADEVNLVALESKESLPASHHEQLGAIAEGIIFNCSYGVKEILGENGLVTGVILQKVISIFDEEGRFDPVYSKEIKTLECDTIIFATGQIVEDITNGKLEQGRGGRYIVDKDTLSTSMEGVFVAGDSAGSNIVVEAMALGKKAGISLNRYLDKKDLKEGRDFETEVGYISKLEIPLPKDIANIPRNHTREVEVKERIKNFIECDLGFDDETAIKEASRCLKCECKKCMVECIMFNDFTSYPGELFEKFLEKEEMDPIICYSCNMCDQCTLVCPEEYKFAELFGAIRKDMVKENNGNSPMKGHKAINMHQQLGFSKLFTTRQKGGMKNE